MRKAYIKLTASVLEGVVGKESFHCRWRFCWFSLYKISLEIKKKTKTKVGYNNSIADKVPTLFLDDLGLIFCTTHEPLSPLKGISQHRARNKSCVLIGMVKTNKQTETYSLRIQLPYDPAVLSLLIYLRNTKSLIRTDICKLTFMG